MGGRSRSMRKRTQCGTTRWGATLPRVRLHPRPCTNAPPHSSDPHRPHSSETPPPATDDPETSAHCPCPPTRRRTPLPVGGPRECKSIHSPVRLPSKFFGPRSKVRTSWVLTAHVLCYSQVKTHLATTGRVRAQGVQALNCRVASLLALTPSLRSVVLIPTYRTDCGPSPPS